VSQASRRLFQFQEGYFSVLGRFCANSNSEKVGSFVFIWTTQSCIQTPISVEKLLNSSSVHPFGHHRNTSRRPSEFEKIPVFLCRHGLGRQLASVQMTRQHRLDAVLDKEITCRQLATVRTLGQHRPDVALIWKRVKRVMERRLHSSLSGFSMLLFGRALEKLETNSF
jgi:hypothetical protein